MTREEAIKDIQENIKPFVGGKSLDMAIEALQSLSKPNNGLQGSDLIRREDIPYVDLNSDMPHSNVRVWIAFKESIDALPSAEAVQGEWIDIDNYYRMATCSHCHKVTMFEKWGERTQPYDFCPNCGAKMKGGDDE